MPGFFVPHGRRDPEPGLGLPAAGGDLAPLPFQAGAGNPYRRHETDVPADVAGGFSHLLDSDGREALVRGPRGSSEWLAYAQHVHPAAHAEATLGAPAAQQDFRARGEFDRSAHFLGPDGMLYQRHESNAESPGWGLRRQLLSLAGVEPPSLRSMIADGFAIPAANVAEPAGTFVPAQKPAYVDERRRTRQAIDRYSRGLLDAIAQAEQSFGDYGAVNRGTPVVFPTRALIAARAAVVSGSAGGMAAARWALAIASAGAISAAAVPGSRFGRRD